MSLIVTFILGVVNFALHKAVLESRSPLLDQLAYSIHRAGARIGLGVEFVVLLAAMLLVANGHPSWGWAYFGYSLVNGIGAWLILDRRL